jgi:LacI family transcriptional regulator, purine nucleotide synthesis repressor
MANIKQLAKMAGVSVSTVSRVLNNQPYVREDKRKAVLEAVKRLNYSRNMNAIHLITGKTNMIGVMLPYINHAYFARIIEGIAAEALHLNYQLIFFQTNYNPNEELKALDMLKMKQIDGMIICSKSLQWEQIEHFTQYGPILACEDTGKLSISSIYIDHYACFQLGLQYLIEQGHKYIGYCLGRAVSGSSQRRRKAYFDALASIHETVREEWMFHQIYSIEDGAAVVHQLLSMRKRPTALLVTSDQVAVGIITEARKNGIRIPEDLAVIGFDNQPIAKVFDMTTIDNKLFEMGTLACRIVHDQIVDKQKGPENRELKFQLIERSTV